MERGPALAANLEAQGKVDEALATYQKISTTYANSFSAPLALFNQARLLVLKGKTEDGRRLYEQVMAQHQDNVVAQQASQELRKLKKYAAGGKRRRIFKHACVRASLTPAPTPGFHHRTDRDDHRPRRGDRVE